MDPSSPELIEKAKQEAEYVNREKDGFSDSADKAASEANTTARALSGQLLLISGAVLTFSSAMITSHDAIRDLSHDWKKGLIAAWALMVFSAAAGVMQVLGDYNFFYIVEKI